MMGAATEKARLPRFSFVLGIESCCEVDDLRSEDCYRCITPHIGPTWRHTGELLGTLGFEKYDMLQDIVRKRKVRWFGHVCL